MEIQKKLAVMRRPGHFAPLGGDIDAIYPLD
jgi:hypothetical protein